ncbi:MAG TPA: aminotransferase class I/II-fold pyridoxal phosphate-dependent enzyme [Candidatus Tyrphobacter sp.]
MKATRLLDALPVSTPFVGPERLMRESGRPDLVRLGANESAFGPSPRAVEAMSAELGRLSWYGDPDSYALREALAAKHGCAVEQIVVGSGIDDLMGLAVRGFVEIGGVAVAARGTYPTFAYHVAGYGGRLETAPYTNEGEPDLDALASLAQRVRPSVVYLANPDNPSGSFIKRARVARFYESLPPGALLLLDEAYADFADEGTLLEPHFDDRLVRVRTFSKAYGLAGARIGYALTTRRNAEHFEKIRLQYGVNRNAQIGALAALQDRAYLEWVVRETAAARNAYEALARELGTTSIPSLANFVCIDMGDAQRATRVTQALLQRGVWIRKPGAPPLDRYIRVSTGTAPMREAFARALRVVLDEVPAAAP